MNRNIVMCGVAALALVAALSSSPVRAADGLPAITEQTAPHEIGEAGKLVAVLVAGSDADCKDCAAVDTLLASNAAAHANEKFVKIVIPGVKNPGLMVFAPGIEEPVYRAQNFHPTASDIGTVLSALDGMSAAATKGHDAAEAAAKTLEQQTAALKAEADAFFKPYNDRVTAVKSDMQKDPTYVAAKAKIDAIYAKAGVTDKIAALQKARDAQDIAAYFQLQQEIAQALQPYKGELQPAMADVKAAVKPFQDKAAAIEKEAQAALEKAKATDATKDFEARAQKIQADAEASLAPAMADAQKATEALDAAIKAEQPAPPAATDVKPRKR
jgi:hypothetical protein